MLRVKGQAATEGFAIEHFAGSVTYTTKLWLDKNKDPLNGDLMVLMQFSDNEMLKRIFTEPVAMPSAGQKFKNTKFKGIIDTFRVQAPAAAADAAPPRPRLHHPPVTHPAHPPTSASSSPSSIRSSTPRSSTSSAASSRTTRRRGAIMAQFSAILRNYSDPTSPLLKAPDCWEQTTLARQLHTSGVLDALRVARTGFPDRMPFDEFTSTFEIVCKGKPPLGTSKQQCEAMLKSAGIPPTAYRLGKERVFLGLGVLAQLKTARLQAMGAVVTRVQAGARGMKARITARSIRAARLAKLKAMEAAAAGDDVDALRRAIKEATAARVKDAPGGPEAIAKANARLAALEKAAAERAAAAKALAAAMEGATGGAALATTIAAVEAALADAKAKGVDAEEVEKGSSKLGKLRAEAARREEEERKRKEEEERRRREEEARRKEEEARLAAVAAAERKKEEERLAEERRKREAAEAAAKAEADAKAKAAEEAAMAAAAEAEKAEAAALVRQKSEIIEQQKAAAARAEEDAAEAEAARQVKHTRTRRHVTPYLTPHIPHIYRSGSSRRRWRRRRRCASACSPS